MSIANFEALCAGLCDFAGVELPAVEPDANGNWALTWEWEGVHVSAFQLAAMRSSAALLVVLGAVPEEQALAAWTTLLEANSLPPRGDGMRFARDPQSGEAVMLWACSLPDIAVGDAIERMSHMVEVAGRWAQDPLSPPRARPGHAQAEQAARTANTAVAAAPASFRAWRRRLCEAAGVDAPAFLEDDGGLAFPMRIDGIDITVGHVPGRQPDGAVIAVRLDGLLPAQGRLAYLVSLMDANYAMGLQPDGPMACRDFGTGATLLNYACALTEDGASRCLREMKALAEIVRDWSAAMARETEIVRLDLPQKTSGVMEQ